MFHKFLRESCMLNFDCVFLVRLKICIFQREITKRVWLFYGVIGANIYTQPDKWAIDTSITVDMD